MHAFRAKRLINKRNRRAGVVPLVATLVGGLLLVSPAPATAIGDTPPPEEEETTTVVEVVVETYDSDKPNANVISTRHLSGAESANFDSDVEMSGDMESTDGSGSGGTSESSGCRRLTVKNYEKSTFGTTLLRFDTWTRWCWTRSNQRIYDVRTGWDLPQQASTMEWMGIINKNITFYDWGVDNGYPRSAHYHMRQGHAKNCWYSGYCLHVYPKNIIKVYANGTWAWRTSS